MPRAETTTQYRLVGNGRRRTDVVLGKPGTNRSEQEERQDLYRSGGVYHKLRIQTRTITETPWEDVTDAKG